MFLGVDVDETRIDRRLATRYLDVKAKNLDDAVIRIERPYAYRRYRPAGYVSRSATVRDHRDYNRPVYRDARPVYRDARPAPAPAVRDHRTYQPAPARTAPAPAPAVRDHRTAPSSSSRRSNVTVRDHR